MKKTNVFIVTLLSLSLLTGCATNKIEHSQQEIKQEKVEKAKKEIASENKREKPSSTKVDIPNSNESTQVENDYNVSPTEANSPIEGYVNSNQGTNQIDYTTLIENGACLNNDQISEVVKKHIEQEHKVSMILSVHGTTTTIICKTCGNHLDEWQNSVDNCDTQGTQQEFPISYAPAWWRECKTTGHRVVDGLNPQTDKYCWGCIDCNKEEGYKKCNEHNEPATPEHMQLHLN